MARREIDLVYVLGNGTAWRNNEIRFSLRSVEQNLTGVRRVYVVGEKPLFVSSDVVHIAHPDPLRKNADGNMALKILRACAEQELSDEFLFMNDDFIIHKKMSAPHIPWMHKGDMAERPDRYWRTQFYRYRLKRTFDVLLERGYPTMQYDYHAPMRMNKHKFVEVMSQFDFEAGIGYTFRSLYGNCLSLPCVPVEGRKVTIYDSYTMQQIDERTNGIKFIGYNNKGLNDEFKMWLLNRFADKSKYERIDFDVQALQIHNWLNSSRDYDQGVSLLMRDGLAHSMKGEFRGRRSKDKERKLARKMKILLGKRM